ncbi:hypothetical protein [Lentzea cavernae]|uniref:Uncharacterized protein n=1 Tax=Lentzea cavernae TaxID=2020703 RepID=A0ABQ3MST7_9PSEU|nr:hypothetical protein [Lentzea cavernae]GHH56321.1 hypothetical protein GCM10017774_74200 [Lentzea cavernae]
MSNWIPQAVAGFDWAGVRVLVDVGSLLVMTPEANPGVCGNLVAWTRPQPVRVRCSIARARRRTEVTCGQLCGPSLFENAFLLSDVSHNWNDENAHRILARCVATIDRAPAVKPSSCSCT